MPAPILAPLRRWMRVRAVANACQSGARLCDFDRYSRSCRAYDARMITNGRTRSSRNGHGRGRQVGQAGLLILVAITVGGCAQALERNAGKTARYEVSGNSSLANNATYEVTTEHNRTTAWRCPGRRNSQSAKASSHWCSTHRMREGARSAAGFWSMAVWLATTHRPGSTRSSRARGRKAPGREDVTPRAKNVLTPDGAVGGSSHRLGR
jgi:hypothetical protein